MNQEITIQKAEQSDALEIGEVFYKTWLATYPNEKVGVTKDDIEYIWRNRKEGDGSRFASFRENEIFLTAKESGEVVGLCSVILHEDKNELKAIYVLLDYQGKGIGKMLWNEMLNYFNKNVPVVIEVAEYNISAIEFYKKLGFEETGKKIEMAIKMKSGTVIPEIEMVLPVGKF